MTLPSRTAHLAHALLFTLALAGCSGGGGSDSAESSGGEPGHTPSPGALAVACTDCAALDAGTYAGAGVGLWQKTNTSGADLNVPVSIAGIAGQDVMLVITNETSAEVAFPAIRTALADAPRSSRLREASGDVAVRARQRIAEFNRDGWVALAGEPQPAHALAKSVAPLAAAARMGDTRAFFNGLDDTLRQTTLAHQAMAGTTQVNLWVETTELSDARVTGAHLARLAAAWADAGGVQDMVAATGGPLWGAHGYTTLIAPEQPVDIVLLNFDGNARPWGTVGYFWALNNFRRTADARSNESLALFLDTETLYLGGASGVRVLVASLAHEAMHMANFYRRGVRMGASYSFATWLEEMSAMMMEEAAALRLDPDYSPVRDMRLRDYLAGAHYNCALTALDETGECDSYAVGGAFGGFLLRQLGMEFFRTLLGTRQTDSVAALEAAIAAAQPGSGLGEQLRRFTVSAAGGLGPDAPVGYGFAARFEDGFALADIDASRYARALPDASPALLRAWASVPVVRRAVRGPFVETVRVPAGATLSVLVR